MTNLAYYTKRIQDCFEANSSWNGDLNAALALYTMGGDWNAQVDWIPELLADQTDQDFDAEEVEQVREEWDLEEMAETALNDWIEANAVDNFFDDVPCYGILYTMDEDERNQMFLNHAEEKGCSYKAWFYLLDCYTDWLYEQEVWTTEETLERANKQVELAKAAGEDPAEIVYFIEEYTKDNA